MLEFLGRGSAFSAAHNNAYFIDGSDLVLIDCSMLSLGKIIELVDSFDEPPDIYVIVTHTHSDHISGIGMLIHYACYIWHIPVTVAAPSEEVAEDLRFLCERLDGCSPDSYVITQAALLPWVRDVIPTVHSDLLDGRCFGYHMVIDGRDVVYTGDTAALEPYMQYIGEDTVLYTEISAVRSPVHLYIEDVLDTLLEMSAGGTEIYLMHIDDEDEIRAAIKNTLLRLAPTV
ncbi:MAG: MBL fold metallo-hydrolase [Oscillospiraceae bacterium]|nr:MBL fold metallo-hydrolase [Oscillospiraceae bacterium]